MRYLILSTLVGVLSVQSIQAHELDVQQDHISVVGTGEIEQEPDQAILNISVNAQEPTLIEAKQLADQRYLAVLEQIKAAGIDEKDIKATRIDAQPQYEWGNNKRIYKGELVSRSLSVTINDLDKVSALMQAVVENGASTIDGITTGFQNPEALQQQALGLAADDARSKAEFLASRLGRDLGQAFLITEQNYTPRVNQANIQMMRSATAMSEDAPPEMFGTQKITATINVSFSLL